MLLGVLEEKSVLPTARPTVQAFLRLADDVGKVAIVRWLGSNTSIRSIASHERRSSLKLSR